MTQSRRRLGGIRRLYDLHALVPRLGLFKNNLAAIPCMTTPPPNGRSPTHQLDQIR